MEWITLLAILVGPLLAVLAARYLDQRKQSQDRKQQIFNTLMRTRRAPTSQDHVGALNLIEIEYRDYSDVIAAWKKLLEHFGTEHIRKASETKKADDSIDRINQKESEFQNRLFQERQSLLAKLLHAMAKSLRFKIEQLEIFEGGYLPQGWVDIELEGVMARKYVLDLASGRRLLPVGVIDYSSANVASAPEEMNEIGEKST